MLLPTLPIIQTIIFSTLVTSVAVPDPVGNIDRKAIALEGECIKQGGLCARAPCCKNSGLACRVDGHGMHFCELDNPSPRSTLSAFHEIFQKFRGRASSNLDSFPIPPRHQLGNKVLGDDEVVINPIEERIDMKLGNYLKLGHELIAAKAACGKAGSSCDFHQGEHCCPSLVCYMTRGSDISKCRLPTDGRSKDEEIPQALRKPSLSLQRIMNSREDEKMPRQKEEKQKEIDKWDFLEAIRMPPRLDDITELPKCKPINMKCNPISGIRVCCPDLDCLQVGPTLEDFECRKARPDDVDEKERISVPNHEREKSISRFQWFLSRWRNQKSKDSGRETSEGNERTGESERIDDDEVLSL